MKSGARESTVSQDMWLQNQTQKSNNKQTCQNEEEGKKKEGIFYSTKCTSHDVNNFVKGD